MAWTFTRRSSSCLLTFWLREVVKIRLPLAELSNETRKAAVGDSLRCSQLTLSVVLPDVAEGALEDVVVADLELDVESLA